MTSRDEYLRSIDEFDSLWSVGSTTEDRRHMQHLIEVIEAFERRVSDDEDI